VKILKGNPSINKPNPIKRITAAKGIAVPNDGKIIGIMRQENPIVSTDSFFWEISMITTGNSGVREYGQAMGSRATEK